MSSPQKVAPEVFLCRASDIAMEMQRLNDLDDRTLYITRRGLRLGGKAAWIWLMLGSFIVPMVAMGVTIPLLLRGSSPSQQAYQTAGNIVPLEALAIPVLVTFTMGYYARWRLWVKCFTWGIVTIVGLAAVMAAFSFLDQY